MIAETATREIFLHLPGWAQAVFYVLGFAALGVFGYGALLRIRKYRRGRKDPRSDQLGARLWNALTTVLSNRTVRQGDRLAGAAHTMILWGFLALFVGTCIVALDHDVLRLVGLKLLQGWFYLGFSLVLDLFGIAFLVGLVVMLWRRAVLRPKALDYTRADPHGGHCDRSGWATDDALFLWLLLLIGVSGYVVEAARIGQGMPSFERWSPVGFALAGLLGGAPAAAGAGAPTALHDVHLWAWWLHGLLALAFVAYIPFSKLVHMLTDFANLTFVDPHAGRRLPALPTLPAAADGAPKPQMGYATISDFTWKELLDFDACTKCGRCHVACPANAAGTTLSPRDLILDLRTFANGAFGTRELLEQRFANDPQWPAAGGAALAVDVAKHVVRPETLWSCTTCMACMRACPVGIEHLTSIVQLRRHLVDQGTLDTNLQGALQNLGEYGNSFGQSPKKRAAWTKSLPFKLKDARKEPVQYLWFVGDFASYDPRLQALSRLVATVLQRAGVDFGILYDAERNAGNDVRRVGEEGLFEQLADENIEALRSATFERIVTTDPHSLNTLKNEYPERGARHDVLHYTGLLAQLLADGRLEPKRRLGHKVTYHDPCYLARYNGEITAPRQVMRALGLELVDMPRCGANTFCCGAGGGRIWMDTSNEQRRTSEQRIEEALALGDVRWFVTACPKDYTMYTDAVKTLGVQDRLKVVDLIELVEAATCAESAPAS